MSSSSMFLLVARKVLMVPTSVSLGSSLKMSLLMQLWTSLIISRASCLFTGYSKSALFFWMNEKKLVVGKFLCIFLNLEISRSLNLGDFLLSIFCLHSSLRIQMPVGSKMTQTFLYLLVTLESRISCLLFRQPQTTGKGAFRYYYWSGMMLTTGQGYQKGRMRTLVKRKMAQVRMVGLLHTNTIFYSSISSVSRSRNTSRVNSDRMQYAQSQASRKVRESLLSCRQALLLPHSSKSSSLSTTMGLLLDYFLSCSRASFTRPTWNLLSMFLRFYPPSLYLMYLQTLMAQNRLLSSSSKKLKNGQQEKIQYTLLVTTIFRSQQLFYGYTSLNLTVFQVFSLFFRGVLSSIILAYSSTTVKSSTQTQMAQTLLSGLSSFSMSSSLSDCPQLPSFLCAKVGSKLRMKLLSFSLERLMISRLQSCASFPVIILEYVPEGQTNRAVCYSICEGLALLEMVLPSYLRVSSGLLSCYSAMPQTAHYLKRERLGAASAERSESIPGISLTELGSIHLKDLISSRMSWRSCCLGFLNTELLSLARVRSLASSSLLFFSQKARVRFSFSQSLRQSSYWSSWSWIWKTEVWWCTLFIEQIWLVFIEYIWFGRLRVGEYRTENGLWQAGQIRPAQIDPIRCTWQYGVIVAC